MEQLKCPGAGRDAENTKCVAFYFNRMPTDDELRYLHEVTQRAALMCPLDKPELKLVQP